jgi:hypothetical protein
MKKKLLLLIFGSIFLALTISLARANIDASIEVKDPLGNSISGATVPLTTVAHVFGHYEDLDGDADASATMQVYFDDDPTSGTGWEYRDTLFSGTINDGDTIEETYAMTELGYYQFRWTVENFLDYAHVRTTVGPVIPEPGTLAGLTISLSALGLLFAKKRFSK